jgi:hypothetical protein
MFAGVGIIGVLASILSSILVGSPATPTEEETPITVNALADENELAAIKNELAEMRQLMQEMSTKMDITK